MKKIRFREIRRIEEMNNRYSLSQAETQRLLNHDLTYILDTTVPSSLCPECAGIPVPVLCCARCALLRADHRDAQIRSERLNVQI